MDNRLEVTDALVSLVLVSDTGTVLGTVVWRAEAPRLVPIAAITGVLNSVGVTALRTFCDTVLMRMQQGIAPEVPQAGEAGL